MENKQQEIDDENEIEATQHVIEHIHKKEANEEYAKEMIITGVNKSIYLKTNQEQDTLKDMIELGLKTLKTLDSEAYK